MVWIIHPANKPIKNEKPAILPYLEVRILTYTLSGPGLIAKRKLDNMKEDNNEVKLFWFYEKLYCY